MKPAKSSVAAFELWLVIEKYVERAKMPGFVARIFNRFAHGVINKAFYSISPDMMIAICQKRWYIMRIAELTSSVSLLQATLDLHDFEQKMNEYSDLSLKLFQNFLAQKYPDSKRQQFSLEDMWKNSSSFIKEYPVILSTIFAAQVFKQGHMTMSSLTNRHRLTSQLVLSPCPVPKRQLLSVI